MNLLALALIATVHFSLALAAQTITVIVAPQGRLEYDPPYVRMGPGDTVLFIFQDARHSVTQSEPDKPCIKLPIGSDTQIAPSSIGTREEHSFTLYDSYDGEPRYFYSATHCQDGMVFAINPPAGALDSYRAAARSTGGNNSPPPSPPPQTQPQPNPPSIITVTVGGSVTTIVPEPSSNPQQPLNPSSHHSSATPTSPLSIPLDVTTASSSNGSATSPSPSGTTGPQSARPGAPGSPYEHIIGVGVDGLLAFSPARIQALVGDVVTFEVRSGSHSIVQSSFEAPCQPLVQEDGHLGFRSGILSGGKQAAGDFAKISKFSIQVNDTTPIYAFDGQTEHCKSGMVFAINVKSEDFAVFQESARLGSSRTRAEGDSVRTLVAPIISLGAALLSLFAL